MIQRFLLHRLKKTMTWSMPAVEMSRHCNIIWEWGIKVISLKNCSCLRPLSDWMLTFISGKLFLTRSFWFWWCIGVAFWYLRMPLHWDSSPEHTLEVTLPALLHVLWFADREAVKWKLKPFAWNWIRGCTAGADLVPSSCWLVWAPRNQARTTQVKQHRIDDW